MGGGGGASWDVDLHVFVFFVLFRFVDGWMDRSRVIICSWGVGSTDNAIRTRVKGVVVTALFSVRE